VCSLDFSSIDCGDHERSCAAPDARSNRTRQSPARRAWFTASGRAIACLGEGQFEEGAEWARKALAQNPRYSVAMRLLAANLANLGRTDGSAEAIADMLRIEPDLTMRKLRARLLFMHDALWRNLSRGLKLAGLPD